MSDTSKSDNPLEGGTAPRHCSVSSARRAVIGNKILAALDDEGTVEILANEEMLNDLVWVMENYIGAGRDRQDRMESMHADLSRLRDAVFPRNDSGVASAPQDFAS